MKTTALIFAICLTSCTISIDPVTKKPIFTIDPETTHAILDSIVTDFNTKDKTLPIVDQTK